MHTLKYTLNDIPPSNNKFIGRNVRWKYQEVKKMWAEKIFFLCRPRPSKPLTKSVVTLTYYFCDKRRRDPDNYSGKMILDGLVRAGILQDDSFNNIDLVLRGDYDKDNPRTEIEIKEV
jgi:Holliday junction resolvase RusA-like endonuclease